MTIKLYGSKQCHKSDYYKTFLETRNLDYVFLDVIENAVYAEELCNLYKNRKLNFPTLLLGEKKLRNPKDNELDKWINKLNDA
ncbi:glutaredoxin family protein [Hanstruepera marina]|uniref:glutaredoxin family protein n=1 Tax=Hanstruepera marina TaxID=2873265 RepID=UPI0021055500|nr:glutaredoxin family protein [Hanstruepera marina]